MFGNCVTVTSEVSIIPSQSKKFHMSEHFLSYIAELLGAEGSRKPIKINTKQKMIVVP